MLRNTSARVCQSLQYLENIALLGHLPLSNTSNYFETAERAVFIFLGINDLITTILFLQVIVRFYLGLRVGVFFYSGLGNKTVF